MTTRIVVHVMLILNISYEIKKQEPNYVISEICSSTGCITRDFEQVVTATSLTNKHLLKMSLYTD